MIMINDKHTYKLDKLYAGSSLIPYHDPWIIGLPNQMTYPIRDIYGHNRQ